MNYSKTIDTADFSDCVNTGWEIKVSPSLLRFEAVSRWQGSRNGIAFLYDNDGDASEEWAKNTAHELDELLAAGAIDAKRGASYRGFRCINSGYVVR